MTRKPQGKAKLTDAERHKPNDPAQYKRFLEAARKAQADETEEGANCAFKRVALSKKPSKTTR